LESRRIRLLAYGQQLGITCCDLLLDRVELFASSSEVLLHRGGFGLDLL
jgi:hypothetical protein